MAVFAIVLAVYLAATPRTNRAYRHFVYQADAFLHGRVDLQGLPGYYHDVVRVGDRVYAPFPPVPAVVLMPVVAVAGTEADQGRVGQVLAAAAVAALVAALRRLGVLRPTRLYAAAALAFGSVLWPATAIGTTWYFAHAVAVLLVALLIWELAGPARPGIAGLLVTAGWLSRPPLAALVPVLAVLLWRRHRRVGAVIPFAAVVLAGAVVYLIFNALRFGDPIQTGYPLHVIGAPLQALADRWGFFNLRYVPQHLYTMLIRPPALTAQAPFLQPSPWGMGLIFTSPYALRLLVTRPREGWQPWATLSLALAVPMLFYFSVGWVQFGYRYSLDWWPFLLVVLALAQRGTPRAIDWALLGAAVAMNGLGVYWVRALGW